MREEFLHSQPSTAWPKGRRPLSGHLLLTHSRSILHTINGRALSNQSPLCQSNKVVRILDRFYPMGDRNHGTLLHLVPKNLLDVHGSFHVNRRRSLHHLSTTHEAVGLPDGPTSSNITIGLLLKMARARPTSCRSPWLRLRPPVSISMPSVQRWRTLILRKTDSQSSSECSSRGSRFWRRVPGKRTGSWARNVYCAGSAVKYHVSRWLGLTTRLRRASFFTIDTSMSSMIMRPDSGATKASR